MSCSPGQRFMVNDGWWVQVSAAPLDRADVIAMINPGDRGLVLCASSRWVLLALSTGQIGWVTAGDAQGFRANKK